MFLEIACFDFESALIAAKAGADRIEFCSGVEHGGLTPDEGHFVKLRRRVKIPLYVMIRPREGDFNYTDEEFNRMKQHITRFKSLRADGFVFGILHKNMKADEHRNRQLVEWARPLPCTFHRAFDRSPHYLETLETVMGAGFKTILCSGHTETAMMGMETLKKLIEVANRRIEIMPGGGIRSSNIQEIAKVSGANFFHSSGIVTKGHLSDEEEIVKMKQCLAS